MRRAIRSTVLVGFGLTLLFSSVTRGVPAAFASSSFGARLTVADADLLRPIVSLLATDVVLARADSKLIAGSDGWGWIGFEVLASWKGDLRAGDTFDLGLSLLTPGGVRFANKDSYLLYLYRCPGEETYREVYRPFRAGIDGDSIEVGFGRYPVPSDPRFPGAGGEMFPTEACLDSSRAVLDRSTLQAAMQLSPCVVSGRVIDRVIPERGGSLEDFSIRIARSAIYRNVRAVVLPETLDIRTGAAPGTRWRSLGMPSVEPGNEVVIGLDSDAAGFHFVHPILTVAHLLADGTAVSVLQRSRCGAGADSVDTFVPANLRR